MTELLPCPFCGSDDIDPTGWTNSQGDTGPECMGCGATAGSVEAWSRRAAPPIGTRYRYSKRVVAIVAPTYPTEQMADAFADTPDRDQNGLPNGFGDAYEAMLAALPEPSSE